jgi:CHAT domain-containing protein
MLEVRGNAFLEYFHQTGVRESIATAISTFELTTGRLDATAMSFNNLAAALRERYDKWRDSEDLRRAGSASRQAVENAEPDDEHLGMYLSGLVSSLVYEYDRNPSSELVEEAMAYASWMVEVTAEDDPRMPQRRSRLASVYELSFTHSGSLSDLTTSIAIEESIQQYGPRYRHNLAVSSVLLYDQTGDIVILDHAVEYARLALAETSRQEVVYSSRLATLAQTLFDHYSASGEIKDLDESIGLINRVLGDGGQVPPAYRRRLLGLRATCRRERAELGLEKVSLTELSDELREAYSETPTKENIRALAVLEQEQLSEVADPAAYDAAVSLAEAGLDAQPPSAPGRVKYATRLGNALSDRYRNTGNVGDLERAIAVLDEAMAATPITASEWRPLATGLAVALKSRGEMRHRNQDVDRAIDLFTEVHAKARHPNERASAAGNLSFALAHRSALRNSIEDARVAVLVSEETLEVTPKESPCWANRTNSYCNALEAVWALDGGEEILRDLVERRREIKEAVSPTGDEFPWACRNLGLACRHLYEISGRDELLEEAKQHMRDAYAAASTLEVSEALRAASALAEWALETEDWNETSMWFSQALSIAEQVVLTQLGRLDQFSWLREVQGMAAKCALACVRNDDAAMAARELERGRLLTMDPRAGLAEFAQKELCAANREDLAQRLEDAVATWSRLNRAVVSLGEHQESSQEAETIARAEQARIAVDDLLSSTQEIVGSPFSTNRDLPVLASSPLVYLSPTSAGTVMVTVYPDGRVDAGELAVDDHEMGRLVVNLGNDRRRRRRHPRRYRKALRRVGEWQRERLIDPLLENLGHPPEIVLVPTGMAVLLPMGLDLCASGTDREGVQRPIVRIAPSGRAAVESENRSARAVTERTLVVQDPQPTQMASLRHSAAETVAARIYSTSSTVLRGEEATPANVEREIADHGVLHFTCHAEANMGKPLSSALVLSGGRLTVGELLFSRAGGARLGILSACETAVAGVEFPDEVVALPTAFLSIGCAGILAAYWPVPDLPTSLLIARFYEGWLAEGLPPVRALQAAQLWLRTSTIRELRAFVEALAGRGSEEEEEALEVTLRALRWRRSGAVPFSDPVTWGAFAYFGA